MEIRLLYSKQSATVHPGRSKASLVSSKLSCRLAPRGRRGLFLRRMRFSRFTAPRCTQQSTKERSTTSIGMGQHLRRKKYGESIENPPPGTASELKQWILDRADVRDGNARTGRLVEDLEGFRHIGVTPLARLRTSIYFGSTFTDKTMRKPIRAYFERLDTRPTSLAEAANVAYYNLIDLALTEKYLIPASRSSPRGIGDMVSDCARWSRDGEWLRRIVADNKFEAAARGQALVYLNELEPVTSSYLRGAFIVLLRDHPEGGSLLDEAVETFEKRREFRVADEVVSVWLRARSDERDLAWAHAIALRARLFREVKRPDEAWVIVEPAVATWKQDVLEEAAEVRIAQRRFQDAEGIVRGCFERYGDGESLAFLIRALWGQDKIDEASRLIEARRRLITSTVWGGIERVCGEPCYQACLGDPAGLIWLYEK